MDCWLLAKANRFKFTVLLFKQLVTDITLKNIHGKMKAQLSTVKEENINQCCACDVQPLIPPQLKQLNILVLVISDSCSKDRSLDKASSLCYEAIKNVHKEPYNIGRFNSDDESKIALRILNAKIEKQAQIIFTLGGTGISPRDVTPEATS